MAAVIVGEEESKASSVISNNVGAAKHMQLCLLDAQGNKTNISSIEQIQTAITLLDDLKQTYDTHTDNHHTEDDALSEQTTILDEVKRFELFRTVIQHEDDLLNQRVSWIFLFAINNLGSCCSWSSCFCLMRVSNSLDWEGVKGVARAVMYILRVTSYKMQN